MIASPRQLPRSTDGHSLHGGVTTFLGGGPFHPCRWPPALPHATGGKPLQALDCTRQHVPFGFEVLNSPVEVHLTPPSGARRHIRAATVALGGSGSPAGSTGRR